MLLWIAFKIVSLKYRKHRLKNCGLPVYVVNCFQNCIFEISETSHLKKHIQYLTLWIAFKIVSLKYRKHRYLTLSTSFAVVNCFQNCIFEISETSCLFIIHITIKLWIAFKIVSLKYRKHPATAMTYCRGVVNCFQNCIFEISETSIIFWIAFCFSLWIAFKIVSLKYRKHHDF